MADNQNDKRYYILKKSVKKALTNVEIPLKTKHARAVVIGTYSYQGSAIFWSIALKQPILENRISAWKFCHLLHKVLRDGHDLCCQESQQNIIFLDDLGKLWSHLNDEYGICIYQYTKLLTVKINFHIRNPRFPGRLKLSNTELEQYSCDDINGKFQLAIEMFDYLDAIIELQAAVFDSMKRNKLKVSSMTSEGQCRVAVLIPCIEDAHPLFEMCLRIMGLLHENLPSDLLEGHQQRFIKMFQQIRSFFLQSKELQYFSNLINVPTLPEQLPTFSHGRELNQPPLPSAPYDDESSFSNLINF